MTISGFDDVIYPVDYRVAGHIVDDEMHNIMSATRPSSVVPKLIAVKGTAAASGCSFNSDLRLVPFRNRLGSSIRILDTGAFSDDHCYHG